MTNDESDEATILSLANENGKFAVPLRATLNDREALALERLQLRDWIRLIDVTPIAATAGAVVRVFRIMPDAQSWLRRQQ